MVMGQRTTDWRFDGPPALFDSLEDFERRSSTPQNNIQIDDDLPIHLHWTDARAEVLLVAFAGAVTKQSASVPAFTGYSLTRDLPADVLLISDPSLILHRDLMLGWYLGSVQQPDLPERIARIIRSVAGDHRIVLFGPSGGGFAALDQGRRLPGSTVVAANPQTDLRRYWKTPVNDYLETAWGAGPDQVGDPRIGAPGAQLSMVEAYGRPVGCRVVYLQGSQDSHHLKHHQRPFLEGLHPDNDVISRSVDLGPGHAPASQEAFRRVIQASVTTADIDALRRDIDAMALDAAPRASRPEQHKGKPTVKSTGPTQPRKTRWTFGGAPAEYGSLREFLMRDETPQGNISIAHGLPIQFYWEDNGADTTFVTFQGNVNSRFTAVPVYTGYSTTEGLSANRLLLSDPSVKIGRDVTLAWYAGSESQRGLQMTLTNIISSLAAGTRVVLFGASGGGFAALEQSTRIPGSTVLAMNPQTEIPRYLEKPYLRYLARCWGLGDPLPDAAAMPFNHSVLDAFGRPLPTQVIYLQNRGDEFHVHDHMEPFMSALHPSNRVHPVMTDLPGGHVIPDKPSVRRLFETVVAWPQWDELTRAVADVPLTLES